MVWILVLELCPCEKKQKTTKKLARRQQTRMLVVLRKSMSALQGGVLQEHACTRDAVLLFKSHWWKSVAFLISFQEKPFRLQV